MRDALADMWIDRCPRGDQGSPTGADGIARTRVAPEQRAAPSFNVNAAITPDAVHGKTLHDRFRKVV